MGQEESKAGTRHKLKKLAKGDVPRRDWMMCRVCKRYGSRYELAGKPCPGEKRHETPAGMPSDFEIKSMVFRIYRSSISQEPSNIIACLASHLRVQNTPEFTAYVDQRLRALAKENEIKLFYLLPGRPAYTIS